MERLFNTAGPCLPAEHYMLPPERRLGHVLRLIEDHRYFTLHAGRQTGKTTSIQWLERHFEGIDGGRAWRALNIDVEMAREEPDPRVAFRSILNTFDRTLTRGGERRAPIPRGSRGSSPTRPRRSPSTSCA